MQHNEEQLAKIEEEELRKHRKQQVLKMVRQAADEEHDFLDQLRGYRERTAAARRAAEERAKREREESTKCAPKRHCTRPASAHRAAAARNQGRGGGEGAGVGRAAPAALGSSP